MKVKNYF